MMVTTSSCAENDSESSTRSSHQKSQQSQQPKTQHIGRKKKSFSQQQQQQQRNQKPQPQTQSQQQPPHQYKRQQQTPAKEPLLQQPQLVQRHFEIKEKQMRLGRLDLQQQQQLEEEKTLHTSQQRHCVSKSQQRVPNQKQTLQSHSHSQQISLHSTQKSNNASKRDQKSTQQHQHHQYQHQNQHQHTKQTNFPPQTTTQEEKKFKDEKPSKKGQISSSVPSVPEIHHTSGRQNHQRHRRSSKSKQTNNQNSRQHSLIDDFGDTQDSTSPYQLKEKDFANLNVLNIFGFQRNDTVVKKMEQGLQAKQIISDCHKQLVGDISSLRNIAWELHLFSCFLLDLKVPNEYINNGKVTTADLDIGLFFRQFSSTVQEVNPLVELLSDVFLSLQTAPVKDNNHSADKEDNNNNNNDHNDDDDEDNCNDNNSNDNDDDSNNIKDTEDLNSDSNAVGFSTAHVDLLTNIQSYISSTSSSFSSAHPVSASSTIPITTLPITVDASPASSMSSSNCILGMIHQAKHLLKALERAVNDVSKLSSTSAGPSSKSALSVSPIPESATLINGAVIPTTTATIATIDTTFSSSPIIPSSTPSTTITANSLIDAHQSAETTLKEIKMLTQVIDQRRDRIRRLQDKKGQTLLFTVQRDQIIVDQVERQFQNLLTKHHQTATDNNARDHNDIDGNDVRKSISSPSVAAFFALPDRLENNGGPLQEDRQFFEELVRARTILQCPKDRNIYLQLRDDSKWENHIKLQHHQQGSCNAIENEEAEGDKSIVNSEEENVKAEDIEWCSSFFKRLFQRNRIDSIVIGQNLKRLMINGRPKEQTVEFVKYLAIEVDFLRMFETRTVEYIGKEEDEGAEGVVVSTGLELVSPLPRFIRSIIPIQSSLNTFFAGNDAQDVISKDSALDVFLHDANDHLVQKREFLSRLQVEMEVDSIMGCWMEAIQQLDSLFSSNTEPVPAPFICLFRSLFETLTDDVHPEVRNFVSDFICQVANANSTMLYGSNSNTISCSSQSSSSLPDQKIEDNDSSEGKNASDTDNNQVVEEERLVGLSSTAEISMTSSSVSTLPSLVHVYTKFFKEVFAFFCQIILSKVTLNNTNIAPQSKSDDKINKENSEVNVNGHESPEFASPFNAQVVDLAIRFVQRACPEEAELFYQRMEAERKMKAGLMTFDGELSSSFVASSASGVGKTTVAVGSTNSPQGHPMKMYPPNYHYYYYQNLQRQQQLQQQQYHNQIQFQRQNDGFANLNNTTNNNNTKILHNSEDPPCTMPLGPPCSYPNPNYYVPSQQFPQQTHHRPHAPQTQQQQQQQPQPQLYYQTNSPSQAAQSALHFTQPQPQPPATRISYPPSHSYPTHQNPGTPYAHHVLPPPQGHLFMNNKQQQSNTMNDPGGKANISHDHTPARTNADSSGTVSKKQEATTMLANQPPQHFVPAGVPPPHSLQQHYHHQHQLPSLSQQQIGVVASGTPPLPPPQQCPKEHYDAILSYERQQQQHIYEQYQRYQPVPPPSGPPLPQSHPSRPGRMTDTSTTLPYPHYKSTTVVDGVPLHIPSTVAPPPPPSSAPLIIPPATHPEVPSEPVATRRSYNFGEGPNPSSLGGVQSQTQVPPQPPTIPYVPQTHGYNPESAYGSVGQYRRPVPYPQQQHHHHHQAPPPPPLYYNAPPYRHQTHEMSEFSDVYANDTMNTNDLAEFLFCWDLSHLLPFFLALNISLDKLREMPENEIQMLGINSHDCFSLVNALMSFSSVAYGHLPLPNNRPPIQPPPHQHQQQHPQLQHPQLQHPQLQHPQQQHPQHLPQQQQHLQATNSHHILHRHQ